MNNKEVAHLWANKSRESAKGSHFFFAGSSIWSYGSHFEIARHVQDDNGGQNIFFTRRDYSSTTSKHKSYVRQAIGSHQTVWLVASFTDHAANVAAYIEDMEKARDNALRARTNADSYKESAEAAAAKAGEYAEIFGTGKGQQALKAKARKWAKMAQEGKLFSDSQLEQVRERVAKSKEETRALTQKRAAAVEAKRKESIEKLVAWSRNETDETPSTTWGFDLPTRLRIEEEGERVVTSRGARISTRTASLLWDRLCNRGDVVGLDLDGYTVRAWDGFTLTVGCHKIEGSEIGRIAALLDLSGELPVSGGR